jgi:GTP pyrophosphokinase
MQQALALPTQAVNDGFTALRDTVARSDAAADLGLIERCYEFANAHHEGQKRKSGEPYVVHPLAVARTIAGLNLDTAAVCAGLLHDTLEDTSATSEQIRELFGGEVQMLVEGVTKLGQIPWHSREERQAENFRRMLLATARDVRVILIKLADRMDNMRTLDFMPREKQERIARETREIYAPLANRLGIQWMKAELEDLCFKYMEPDDHRSLSLKLDETRADRESYIADVSRQVREAMLADGVPAEIIGRTKHLWSLWKRIRTSGRDLEQIPDVMSFRIVTDTVRSCYAALGSVHTRWTPVPGRFKDYIALPKPNRYQSLHTTVVGPRADRIEIQIRTREMHQTAQDGVAAHWRARNGHADGASGAATPADDPGTRDGEAFAWLGQLMDSHRELRDPKEFIESVKIDLFEEEVYVFTPNGDVKTLPKGSTPVDFAYAVHSTVGERCSGARVNGLIVPLRYVLRNGDTVEILASPKQKPSKDWLRFAVTSRARARIRHSIRVEQRGRYLKYGRDLLARALRDVNSSLEQVERDGHLERVAATFRASTVEDLYLQIGYEKRTPADVVARLFPMSPDETEGEGTAAVEPSHEIEVARPARPARRAVGGIQVAGEAEVMVRFAKCCNPVPGEPITAFTTRGRGVLVHLADCERALDPDPDRKVEVAWDEAAAIQRPVVVEVVATDRPGILANLSRAFSEQEINIAQAKCRTTPDSRGINTFHFNVRHIDQLRTLIRALYSVEGVISVTRQNPNPRT